MAGSVSTVPTPNPDALRFRVNEVLVPMGTHEFKPGDDTADAPLARALFAHDGIVLIHVAPRFVTVRKHTDTPWPDLEGAISETLRDFLESGEMAVIEPAISRVMAEQAYDFMRSMLAHPMTRQTLDSIVAH